MGGWSIKLHGHHATEGIEHHLVDLINRLRGNGHDVTLAEAADEAGNITSIPVTAAAPHPSSGLPFPAPPPPPQPSTETPEPAATEPVNPAPAEPAPDAQG
jgi:hypothetical protein